MLCYFRAVNSNLHRDVSGSCYWRAIKIFLSGAGSLRLPAMDTIFSKIIDRKIPADIVYEDDLCLAFRDVNPQAPIHILIVPKKPIPKIADAGQTDQLLLGHLLLTANRIAGELGVSGAFRLVVNNGADAGQSVFHLHIHLLAGRTFNWPPG